MIKKLQIFVSSTYEDLKKERQLVVQAILEMGCLPAGMEYFISDDAQQFEIIKKWIQESDAYILIAGGRYGSINTNDPKKRSYTHMELDYARAIKKPIKILRLTDTFLVTKKNNGDYTESDLKNKKLIDFRKNLPLSNNVNSLEEIKSEAKSLLGKFKELEEKNHCGWIKANDVISLMSLHPNNIDLAKSKSVKGCYNIYYYSTYHQKYVHSILGLSTRNDILIATLKNDVDAKGNSLYDYKGKFEIFDDFLYIELKSDADNERVFAIIKLLPGKLNISMGILLAQGTAKQAVATSFVITKDKITSQKTLDDFRQNQVSQFNKTEKLLVDDNAIKELMDSF